MTPSDLARLTASVQSLSRPNRDDPPACVIQDTLVPGIVPGDDLLISGPGVGNLHVRVLGTLGLGLETSDVPLLVTSLSLSQRVAHRDGEFNTVEVRLADAESADRVAREIAQRLGRGVRVTSWSAGSGGSGAPLPGLRVVAFLAAFSVSVRRSHLPIRS